MGRWSPYLEGGREDVSVSRIYQWPILDSLMSWLLLILLMMEGISVVCVVDLIWHC